MGFGIDGAFKTVELGKELRVVRYRKAIEPAESTG